MLLAIDPGACTGWAYFVGESLTACGLAPIPQGLSPKKVIVECPRLRPRGERNPNSILLVAREAGEWAGWFGARGAEVQYVTPNDWKGSTSKEIDHVRTERKLTADERAVLEACFVKTKGRNGMAKKKRENVYDAIGIGLWAVGR